MDTALPWKTKSKGIKWTVLAVKVPPRPCTLLYHVQTSSSYKISPSYCVVQFNGILQSCHQWPNNSHAFWERDLQQLVPAPRGFASLSAQENVLLSLAVTSRVSSSISPRLATSQSIPSVVLAVRSQFGSFHILSSTWAHWAQRWQQAILSMQSSSYPLLRHSPWKTDHLPQAPQGPKQQLLLAMASHIDQTIIYLDKRQDDCVSVVWLSNWPTYQMYNIPKLYSLTMNAWKKVAPTMPGHYWFLANC